MSVHRRIESKFMATVNYRLQSHYRLVRQYLVYYEHKWYVAVYIHYEQDLFNVGEGSDWWEFYDCSKDELLDSNRNPSRIQKLWETLPKAERFSGLHRVDGYRYDHVEARRIFDKQNAIIGQLLHYGSLTEEQVDSYLTSLDDFSAIGYETEKRLNQEMRKFVADAPVSEERRRGIFKLF